MVSVCWLGEEGLKHMFPRSLACVIRGACLEPGGVCRSRLDADRERHTVRHISPEALDLGVARRGEGQQPSRRGSGFSTE